MAVLALALRALLVGVFAVSGFAKLFRLDRSRQAARDLGVPDLLAPTVGVMLPVVELLVAALLIAQPSARLGAIASVGLLTAFSVVVALNLARDRHPSCNCFGALSNAPIGWRTLLRNAGLLVAATTTWIAGDASDPAEVFAHVTAGQWVLGGLAAVLAAVVVGQGWMIFQLLRQHGRLLIRLDALEDDAGVAAPSKPAARGLPVGVDAPEFSLTGLHGETMTLAALRAAGKPVLLVFGEANCGPCTALMPDVAGWQRDHANKLTVALVTAGPADMNRAKAAEHDLVNVLLQAEREVAEAYRYAGTPSAVLVDVRGRIAAPLVTGAPAIEAMVDRIVAGVPVALGRQDDAHQHTHDHHHAHAAPAPVPIGVPAPAISLPALGGGDGQLAEFAGHRVVVLFWNPGCGFCRTLRPRLLDWERDRDPEGAELLVVSTGDEADNAAEGFSSTVLLDVAGQTMSAYGANGTPMAVLVDAEGNIGSALAVGGDAVIALLSDADVKGSRP